MADTSGWRSLPVRFKIHFLKRCWVCAPLQNIMSSILLLCLETYFINWIIAVLFLIVYREYLTLLFIAVLFFFYLILISFQIYTFYTFCYFIESLKVSKKPKYNSWIKKCLGFVCIYIYIYIYIYYILYIIYIYKWVKRNKEISLLWQQVSLMLFKSTKFFYKI